MNTDRRTILALIAMGRITPSEAERLIAAWNETRETAWILAISLAFVCLTQFHLHEVVPSFLHFLNAQIPAIAQAMHRALSPITDSLGGLL